MNKELKLKILLMVKYSICYIFFIVWLNYILNSEKRNEKETNC